jgi:arylformamidase
MITYPGIPGPVIGDWLSREASRARYAPGTEFQMGRIELIANTGTYIDAPFHRYASGEDIAAFDLGAVADLEYVVVRCVDRTVRAIDSGAFDGVPVAGRAVLVHTGWASRWGTPAYFDGHPFLTAEAADRLVAEGAALVGIDSMNIDGTEGGERPVHSALLARAIPIVEHMRGLEQLPDAGARFFAVPPPIRGLGSFPVRAFAIVDD